MKTPKCFIYASVFVGLSLVTIFGGAYYFLSREKNEIETNYRALTEEVDYWQKTNDECNEEENLNERQKCFKDKANKGLNLRLEIEKLKGINKDTKVDLTVLVDKEIERMCNEAGFKD